MVKEPGVEAVAPWVLCEGDFKQQIHIVLCSLSLMSRSTNWMIPFRSTIPTPATASSGNKTIERSTASPAHTHTCIATSSYQTISALSEVGSERVRKPRR